MVRVAKNTFYLKTAVAFALFLVIQACDRSTVYDRAETIQDSSWSIEDTLSFEFELSDTIHYHDIFVKLRVNSEYPFSNLYFKSEFYGPKGQNISDINSITLANKHGKWLGEGNGNVMSYSFPLIENMQVKSTGKYQLRLMQYMRTSSLKGVQNVGIQVKQTEEIL